MTVLKFFAWLFIIIGALLSLFCGGCGLYFLPAAGSRYMLSLSELLLFAGVPCLVGLGLVFLGASMLPKDDE